MERTDYIGKIERGFRNHSVVALLGPRQCGKTTLAHQFAKKCEKVHYFDLENPRDLAKLQEPMLVFEELEGMIIVDEIQRVPELFPLLRVLVDKNRDAQQYLILGSASRDLIRQSSETLAGRIQYIEVTPFSMAELGSVEQLWIRGGFPRSYLAASLEDSVEWRESYIETFLERDIPQLGINIPSETLRRFWTMLTQYHGNIMNASELGRSFGIAHTTVQHYLDILCGTFMIRRLQPWYENIKKRQVKSPKIYFKDTGILHSLMGIESKEDIQNDPKLGASWEGFALEEVIRTEGARGRDCYFWSTHSGAELDLMILRGKQRLGYEFKYAASPKLTKSMKIAKETLGLDSLVIVCPGNENYPVDEGVRVRGLGSFLEN